MTDSTDSTNSSTEYDENYVETLEVLLDETRSILDHFVGNVDYVNNKAARVIELNALIIGVILSIATFLTRLDVGGILNTLTGPPVIAAVASTVFSITTAYWAIHPQAYAGIDPKNVSRIVDNKPSKGEVLEGIVLEHRELAEKNANETRRSYRLLRLAYVFLFISIGLYSLTLIVAASNPGFGLRLLMLIISVLVLVLTAVAVYPTYRWAKKFKE